MQHFPAYLPFNYSEQTLLVTLKCCIFDTTKDLKPFQMKINPILPMFTKSNTLWYNPMEASYIDRIQFMELDIQGVFYTGPPLKSSKYKKVNLG